MERVFCEQHKEFQTTLSWCVQFSEHVAKIYFLPWNFLNDINFETYFFTFFPWISNITLNMPSRFLSLIFFTWFQYSILFWGTTFWYNVAEKYFIIWYSWFYFINLKEFNVDSMNYLGWESNFSIRPPRVFKILSTKFQWTQTIERVLVERLYMQWF